jgi:hypothetical protein
MALLGSSVDPRLFLQDFSGFTRAAEIQAQGMQNLGQNIGKAISDYADLKKEQKKVDAYNKASAQAIEAGLTLGKAYGVTGVEESLRPFLDAASDPSLSPIEKAAALEQGKAMLPMVFGRYDQSQAMAIQRAGLIRKNQPNMVEPTTYKSDLIDVGGQKLYVLTGSDGYYYDPKTKTPIADIASYARGEAPEVYGLDAGQAGAAILPQAGPVPLQEGAIDEALRYSRELTGGLPSDVEGATGQPIIAPVVDPDAIQSALDVGAPQDGMVLPPKPQTAGEPKSRLIGQPKKTEVRGLTEEERVAAKLPPGNYTGRFTNGNLVDADPIPAAEDPNAAIRAARGAEIDKRALELVNEANTVDSKIANMNEALKLLESDEVKTGTLARYKMEAKKLLGQDVSSDEQFNSLVGNLAMEAIGLTKGAISDREMTYFTQVLAPNQGKSVEGNKKILEFKLAVAKRNKKIAEKVLEMFDQGRSPFEVNQKITEMQNEESLVGGSPKQQAGSTMIIPDAAQRVLDKHLPKR